MSIIDAMTTVGYMELCDGYRTFRERGYDPTRLIIGPSYKTWLLTYASDMASPGSNAELTDDTLQYATFWGCSIKFNPDEKTFRFESDRMVA